METWTSRIRWTIRRFQTDLARHGRAVALREDLAVRSIVVASTLLVGGSLAGLACDEGDDLFLPPPGEEIVVAFEDGPSRFPTADWSLREAELEGDDLVLEIQHAGGCAEHRYWILAVEGFITLPAGSPIETGAVPIRLAHDNGGDLCEALLVRTVRRGLAPLRNAYRELHPDGPARILLRIAEGRGATELRTLTREP